MSATPQPDDMVARMADLQRQIDELGRKTFSQFAVTQYNHPLIKVYPDPTLTNPDGTPFIQMTFGSTTGTIWKLIPSVFSGNIVLKSSWGWFNDQTPTEELLSADAPTGIGLSRPHIPVSFVRYFNTVDGTNSFFGSPNVTKAAFNAFPKICYFGVIPLRSHPYLRFEHYFGWVSGGGLTLNGRFVASANPNLTAGGALSVSFSYSGVDTRTSDLNISSLPYTRLFVGMYIDSISGGAGTDIISLELDGIYLRGTP